MPRGGRRGGRGPNKRREKTTPAPVQWDPRTKLGKLVRSGQITTMGDALKTGLSLREPEIVDVLLPEIDDEVIDVNMVQRMTDSGRRVKFVITVAVGNNDGFVGFGQAKGKEVGSSIRKAIDNAKLNIMEIRRGCGSWECGCGKPHTVPFAVKGKSGSVEITLKPAPHGIGLATGNVAKKILTLAGVKDCWAFTKGKTKTTVNYAKAVFGALEQNSEMRVMKNEVKKVGIVSGAIGTVDKEKQVEEPPKMSESKEEKKKDEKPVEKKPTDEKPEEQPPAEPEQKEEKTTEETPSEEPPKKDEKTEDSKEEGKKEESK
jgi:small subunit ribosomal protein S5